MTPRICDIARIQAHRLIGVGRIEEPVRSVCLLNVMA